LAAAERGAHERSVARAICGAATIAGLLDVVATSTATENRQNWGSGSCAEAKLNRRTVDLRFANWHLARGTDIWYIGHKSKALSPPAENAK
jgi:hypothetical protein